MDDQLLNTAIKNISILPEEDLSLLMSCISRRQLKKGEAILEEGKVCRSFYFVETGYLRTWYNKDGISINLNFTFEGNFASNLKSFKSRQSSEFTIEAGENASVCVFDWDLISDRVVAERPLILQLIRRIIVRLLLASEEHSELFKIYTPKERYHFLERNNPGLLQRVSLSQIASYIGVTRETLSRIRAKS